MATDAPHPAFEGYAAETVPQASVGDPGKEGCLDLTFARAGGETRLIEDYARVPFHVSGTLDHGDPPDSTALYVQSPTGGVAQGDRNTVSMVARPGATALVSTQSATKVQQMSHNYAATEATLSAAEGGHLAYVPDQTILHADARYHETVTIDLAPDATVVFGDVVVPGRLARGERFEFDRYYQRVDAHGPDRRLFEDTTHLGDDLNPDRIGVLGGATVYGTLYVATTTDLAAGDLADEIHGTLAGRASATRLPSDAGVVVRALGDTGEAVTESLHTAWGLARRRLLDVGRPALRKY